MEDNASLVRDSTIDELAAQSDMPVRTLREYQRLGLLPPPKRQGRVGYYGQDHRARLSIVRRLQERGYSLAAIADLIGSWEQGRGLESILGLGSSPVVLDETPTQMSQQQLEHLAPALADPSLLESLTATGLLIRDGPGTISVRSVAAIELVGLAVNAGMPPASAIEMIVGLAEGAAMIAKSATDQFASHLWPVTAGLGDQAELVSVLSRARILLAQASASIVVHELGVALAGQADDDDTGKMSELINKIVIGQVRRLVPESSTTRDEQAVENV